MKSILPSSITASVLLAALAGWSHGQLTGGASLNFVAQDPASGVDGSNWNNSPPAPANTTHDFDFGGDVTLETVSSAGTGITKAYRFTDGNGDADTATWNGLFGEGVATTWEFWLKPDDAGDAQQTIYESGGSGTGYAIWYEKGTDSDGSGTVHFTIDGGGGSQIETVSAVIDTGDFRHITCVYDRDYSGGGGIDLMQIYVDGAFVDDNLSSTTTATTPTDLLSNDNDNSDIHDYCGGDGTGLGNTNNSLAESVPGNGEFDGDIAVFRVWGGLALSAAEITNNYAVFGADSSPPEISGSNPADDALDTYPAQDLVATFNEDIALTGLGTITLTDLTNGTDTRTINLPDAGVAVSNNTLTIDLSSLEAPVSNANLAFSTEYEVTIDSAALEDTADTPNAYGGTTSGEWTFTTVAQNLTAPTVTTYSPADDATDQSAGTNLVATFDQNIRLTGNGTIDVVDLTDASSSISIDLSSLPDPDADVFVVDNVLTIDPVSSFEFGEDYAVQISNDAITNFSDVAYAGILSPDTTTWNFTVISDLLVVHEPFDYSAGNLGGAGGTTEVGLTGTWSASGTANVIDESLFSTVARSGGSIGGLNGGSNNFGGARAVDPAALAANGLLSDGAALYFSMDLGYDTGGNVTNSRLVVVLGSEGMSTSNFDYNFNTAGATGLGVTLGRFGGTNGKVVATLVRDTSFGNSGTNGNIFGSEVGAQFSSGENGVIVGKLIWGATPGDDETLELYRVDPADPTNEGAATLISTLTVPGVDQTAYDTISWSRGDKVVLDEIRYGTTWSSVTPPDVTDPLLVGVSPTGAGDPPGGDDGLFRATFDEPVEAVSSPTGSIIFRNAGDDTVYTTISPTDGSQVSFSGKNLDITPTLLPIPGNSYYIEIEPGALQDPSGNPFAGYTGSATWSFTTDSTPPMATITDNSVNGEIFFSLQQLIYTLSFDEVITTTAGVSDFELLGTAAASIDSVTQTNATTVEVVATATGTGNITLNVKSSASFLDAVGNSLDGPFADSDTILVRDVADLSSSLGILNLTVNNGINPSTGNLWQGNDTYRLAFVWSGTTDANSSDITTYNTLIQNAANTSSLGLGSVTWRAIASAAGDGGPIPAVDARTNTSTNPNIDGTGEAIYLMNGTTRIATSYADLWDGELSNNIDRDEENVIRDKNAVVLFNPYGGTWTGTSDNGTATSALGNGGNVRFGTFAAENKFWENRGAGDPATLAPIYGLSEPLTVTSAVSGTAYDDWADDFPGLVDTDPSDNPDGDTLVNLLEFAFGTDPTVSDAVSLNPDGSVNGLPVPIASGGVGGVDFNYLFARREDHGDSGSVTYTPQFSSDLVTFYDSTATPTKIADSTDDPAYDIVSVPYPATLPDGKKARFARLKVDAVE